MFFLVNQLVQHLTGGYLSGKLSRPKFHTPLNTGYVGDPHRGNVCFFHVFSHKTKTTNGFVFLALFSLGWNRENGNEIMSQKKSD